MGTNVGVLAEVSAGSVSLAALFTTVDQAGSDVQNSLVEAIVGGVISAVVEVVVAVTNAVGVSDQRASNLAPEILETGVGSGGSLVGNSGCSLAGGLKGFGLLAEDHDGGHGESGDHQNESGEENFLGHFI